MGDAVMNTSMAIKHRETVAVRSEIELKNVSILHFDSPAYKVLRVASPCIETVQHSKSASENASNSL